MNTNTYIDSAEYKEILRRMPICCVDIVVLYNDKVLLMKRKNKPAQDQWWVPGGRVLKDEPLISTARRKLHEEIGIEPIGELILLGVDETFFSDNVYEDNNFGTHTINIYYKVTLSRAESERIVLDNNHSDLRFFESTDSEPLHPYIKRLVNQALHVSA